MPQPAVERKRDNAKRADQQPRRCPAPIIAGDRPPAAHPERLVPYQEPSAAEREIWNELRDVLVWPH